MSYTCLDCGALFETPKQFTEKHGLDAPPYETFWGCPQCGGAYSSTIFCDCCGQPITGDYAKIPDMGQYFCDCCFTVYSLGEEG